MKENPIMPSTLQHAETTIQQHAETIIHQQAASAVTGSAAMQTKFEYILTLANLLCRKRVVVASAFASRYRISSRTVKRYIESLRAAGFNIVETDPGTYMLLSCDVLAVGRARMTLDENELALIKDVVKFFSTDNRMATALSNQLKLLFEGAELFSKAGDGINFRALLTIKELQRSRKRALLTLCPGGGYAHGDIVSEPYRFDSSGRYVCVHCPENGGNRVLPLSSVVQAQPMDVSWNARCRHNNVFTDSFGQTGTSISHARVWTTGRAKKHLASWFPDLITDNAFVDFMVCDYKAVFNYVLAFPNEVRIQLLHDVTFD